MDQLSVLRRIRFVMERRIVKMLLMKQDHAVSIFKIFIFNIHLKMSPRPGFCWCSVNIQNKQFFFTQIEMILLFIGFIYPWKPSQYPLLYKKPCFITSFCGSVNPIFRPYFDRKDGLLKIDIKSCFFNRFEYSIHWAGFPYVSVRIRYFSEIFIFISPPEFTSDICKVLGMQKCKHFFGISLLVWF